MSTRIPDEVLLGLMLARLFGMQLELGEQLSFTASGWFREGAWPLCKAGQKLVRAPSMHGLLKGKWARKRARVCWYIGALGVGFESTLCRLC